MYYNPTKYAAAFCFVFCLTACRKPKEEPVSTPTPELSKLKRIEQDTDNYLQLEYAGANVSRLRIANYGFPLDYQITYSNTGKPVEATLLGAYKHRFIYSGGVLSKLHYYNNDDPTVVDGYITFQYDNNNRLVLSTNYYTTGTSFLENAKTAYTYYPNGDVKSIDDSTLSPLPSHFVLEKKTEYEYDTKTNPLQMATEVFYALYLNPTVHNVTKMNVQDAIAGTEQTTTYAYQYNSNNLPVSVVKTTTATGKPTETKTITYTY